MSKIYAEVLPRVEYSLTERGASLIPILDKISDREYEHMDEDIEFKCDE